MFYAKVDGKYPTRDPEAKRKEGEISIDKTPQQNKPSNNDVGEYVDYEEID